MEGDIDISYVSAEGKEEEMSIHLHVHPMSGHVVVMVAVLADIYGMLTLYAMHHSKCSRYII